MIKFPKPRKQSAFGEYVAPKIIPNIFEKEYKKPIIKVGKLITQIDMPFRSYKIVKVMRKNIKIIPQPYLPGIDNEITISFYRVNLEFHG